MPNPAASLREKLLFISKQRNEQFQDLLNRFGSEQFLRRLSKSKYVQRFVFKGGSLLAYRLESTRETKDLDFSIRKTELNNIENIFQEIIQISMDDHLVWQPVRAQELAVPDMPYPGVRLTCKFSLGIARGSMQMDVAAGDVVSPEKVSLQSIQYRDQPLVGENFEIYAYPLETVFAEKLQIVITKGSTNSRMKDYYDLFLLCNSKKLDHGKLIKNIKQTFKNRELDPVNEIKFSEIDFKEIQTAWERFIKSQDFSEVPNEISDVIKVINQKLIDSIGKG